MIASNSRLQTQATNRCDHKSRVVAITTIHRRTRVAGTSILALRAGAAWESRCEVEFALSTRSRAVASIGEDPSARDAPA
ncbi:hypothetical protein DB32_006296 [Sandaracinus amylolyticus]|uniref:Uncharacterized protein n=1 Tax=Sandaracinus amylolyticus TaxID=927083 RepID=A0A0F6YKV8_9BACT|nr:hypothetical protein DB32_006296 [Sandaracinus amylolyticus]